MHHISSYIIIYHIQFYQILQVVTSFGPIAVTFSGLVGDLYLGNQRVTLKNQTSQLQSKLTLPQVETMKQWSLNKIRSSRKHIEIFTS